MSDDVGARIRAEMARRDLGIRDVAEMAGVAPGTVVRARKGQASEAKTYKVLNALGLPTDSITRSDDPGQSAPTAPVRALTVTPELLAVLGLNPETLDQLDDEDLVELRHQLALTVLRVARERRGRQS